MWGLKIARKVALGVGAWAVGPTLAVFAHSMIVPERVGSFEEHVLQLPTFAQAGVLTSGAATEIGTVHHFEIGPVMGFGAAEPRIWRGVGPHSGAPRPVIVLLHGAGDDGRALLNTWTSVAADNDVVLIAPDARGDDWSLITDGPMFLGALLKEVGQHYPMDAAQIYLVGEGAGGAHVMQIANLGGGPFRAVATVSGTSRRFRMIPAITPVKVHGYVLDQNEDDSEHPMRAALQRLAQAGHPVSFTRVPAESPLNTSRARQLAVDMWTRLSDPAPGTLEARADTRSASTPSGVTIQRETDRGTGAKWVRVGPSD